MKTKGVAGFSFTWNKLTFFSPWRYPRINHLRQIKIKQTRTWARSINKQDRKIQITLRRREIQNFHFEWRILQSKSWKWKPQHEIFWKWSCSERILGNVLIWKTFPSRSKNWTLTKIRRFAQFIESPDWSKYKVSWSKWAANGLSWVTWKVLG